MPRSLEVYLIPELIEPPQLQDQTVVVIDVLRATTTITCALTAGAQEVVPCLEIQQAKRQAAELEGEVLLGGERGGQQIPGFDLGNSPMEYHADQVTGRRVVFTTTNGTRAMMRCRHANQLWIGAFVNLTALSQLLAGQPKIAVICAGTDGQISREDTLFAGALTDRVLRHSDSIRLNDQARIAHGDWQSIQPTSDVVALASVLSETKGGRNLVEIGHQRDIQTAATIDLCDRVPKMDLERWAIVLP